MVLKNSIFKNILTNHKSTENRWTDAPIGLHQAGGIRSSIDETDHDGNI